MRCGAHCDTRSRNITRSRTGIAEAAERLKPGEKCAGAIGSLAIVASGHGPSHPRSLHHGSRLPAMSRRGAASSDCDRARSGIGLVPRPAGSPLNTRVKLARWRGAKRRLRTSLGRRLLLYGRDAPKMLVRRAEIADEYGGSAMTKQCERSQPLQHGSSARRVDAWPEPLRPNWPTA
jgi:hypothetical protein